MSVHPGGSTEQISNDRQSTLENISFYKFLIFNYISADQTLQLRPQVLLSRVDLVSNLIQLQKISNGVCHVQVEVLRFQ